MKTEAAILVELGKPLEVVELEVPILKAGQVLVQINFSGVCHTQLSEARGFRGEDRFLPHCLGHEATGVVVEIGEGVSKVAPGDKVVLSWIKGSGADVPGCAYLWNQTTVNSGAVTTFGRHSVVSENRVTKLPSDIAEIDAANLGCAISTGFGSVLNTANLKAGQTVVVFGAGGIGLAAIAAAKIGGASKVVAVDINRAKLDVARSFGATDCLDGSHSDFIATLKELTPKGVDISIEATGRTAIMQKCLEIVRPLGGIAVIVGNAHAGETITIDPRQFNMGKQLRGTWGGDSYPDRDIPRFASLIASGGVDFSAFKTKSYSLAQINAALDDLESGSVVRPLLDMSIL